MPIADGLQALPVTVMPVTGTVPVFVTVPEKTIPTPPTQPSEHVSVTAMLAVSHVQVELAVDELTTPAQGDVAVPWAVTVLVMSPPAAHATVQLQPTEAPGARLPSEPVLQAVPVTLTLFSVTVPVFVTVPENRIPMPPTQPSAHVSVTAMLAVSHVQVELACDELTGPPPHAPPAVPFAVTLFVTSPPVTHATVQLQPAD